MMRRILAWTVIVIWTVFRTALAIIGNLGVMLMGPIMLLLAVGFIVMSIADGMHETWLHMWQPILAFVGIGILFGIIIKLSEKEPSFIENLRD